MPAIWIFRHATCDPITVAALSLTLAGWSLIWASALSVIEFVPLPVTVLLFCFGLVLIPFRPASAPENDAGGA